MNIDMSAGEIWDLLEQGSTNQKNFIESLKYSEFEEFIELWEEEYNYLDLRSCLNGGCLSAEDDPVEDYVIWSNNRIGIVLV